jgi:hypothetical protein
VQTEDGHEEFGLTTLFTSAMVAVGAAPFFLNLLVGSGLGSGSCSLFEVAAKSAAEHLDGSTAVLTGNESMLLVHLLCASLTRKQGGGGGGGGAWTATLRVGEDAMVDGETDHAQRGPSREISFGAASRPHGEREERGKTIEEREKREKTIEEREKREKTLEEREEREKTIEEREKREKTIEEREKTMEEREEREETIRVGEGRRKTVRPAVAGHYDRSLSRISYSIDFRSIEEERVHSEPPSPPPPSTTAVAEMDDWIPRSELKNLLTAKVLALLAARPASSLAALHAGLRVLDLTSTARLLQRLQEEGLITARVAEAACHGSFKCPFQVNRTIFGGRKDSAEPQSANGESIKNLFYFIAA